MIPETQYRAIAGLMPILCVDLVLRNGRGEFLLAKRTNEPLKGEWWVIGGRVQRGETLASAARRKANEELGLSIDELVMLGVYEDFYERSSMQAPPPYHTVSVVFGARIAEPAAIRLDPQHEQWRFAEALPERFRIQPLSGQLTGAEP